ncbi:DUF11 domain-containing protein [Candidatus Bipolaricaulota bacterium]|nr:DUF11 domain-containing protein [Candidatus Bipolaricaulota bacterium]
MRKRGIGALLVGVGVFAACGVQAQVVALTGPTEMGRCEQATFTIAFTADPIQTASAIAFTATRPNVGFAYVADSGLVKLHDGAVVVVEPTPSGLNLVWDLDLLLGYSYALPPGETVTVEFALATGCTTVSGTLEARVDFDLDGVGSWISDSQPVEILPGAVRVEKLPSVTSAGVGDEATWTLRVENTGLGPIYNVVVTDVLGSGLAYVSSNPVGDNLGQTITWDKTQVPELGEILPGDWVDIAITARVVGCSDLRNRADVRFGCDDGSVCFDTAVQGGTATASILLVPRNPLLSWTPPTIALPYCAPSGVFVNLPVSNVGEGTAYNVRMCMSCDPLVVSDVGAGATYLGGCFVLDDPIPAGETFNLTFTVSVPDGWDWCAGGPSGTVLCQTIYENVCGEEFRPPSQVGSFSTTYGPDGPPSLSVSLSGAGAMYICTTEEYDLSVSFSGLDHCGSGATSDISVVVNVPTGFTVADSGDGTWVPGGDGTGGTISWTTPPTTPLSTSFALSAPGRLQCGQVGTLTATATATDCCGCGISASDSAPIAVQCYQLVTTNRTATPSTQEKCGEITYTNTYTFASSGPAIYFTDLTFTAYAENLQQYVAGSLEITVDGVPKDPVNVMDATPGGSLEIEGIHDSSLVWGKTLVISYRLKFTPASSPTSCPSSYSFYTWTTLDLGPGCTTGDDCTQPCQVTETLVVTATTPSMSVAIAGLPTDFVDPCGTYTVTVTLTKTSVPDPHNVRLRLSSLNYYIVDLASIGCSGVCPTSSVPTEYGDYYEWEYGSSFVGEPNGAQSVLTFQVRKRCGPGRELSATALFTDSCEYSSCSVSASRTPLFLRQPLLYGSKTPEVIYATQNPVTWTIYVTNGGAGPAYEVWVDDLLGNGLEYVSSTADPDVQTYPNEDHMGGGINGVSWRIPVIAPGATRTLTVTARMTSCTELSNWVQAGVGCGGEDCLVSAPDTATVVIPTTNIVATASTNSPISTCATQYATITIRNAGDPAVYNLGAEVTLPTGISYVSGSTEWRKNGGSWFSGDDPIILGSTLTWSVDQIPGADELRSRQNLEIRFQIRADCAFIGGSLPFTVFYENVCSAPGSTPVGTFNLLARQPQISVTKTQTSPPAGSPLDCGGNVTWEIVVRNTGPIPVPYVLVEDEMAPGFTYVSSSPPGTNLGSITTWEITDLPLNGTATFTLTAQAPGAADPSCTDLSNTVRASWGCPPPDPCLTDVPASATTEGTRTPTVSLSTSLSPSSIEACGEATFTLTIQNTSTTTARAVDARITLPSGLSYVPNSTEIDCGAGFGWAPDPTIAGQALIWYDETDPGSNLCAEIPPSGSAQVRFRVKGNCYVTAGNASIRVWYYDCCETTQRTTDASRSIPRTTPTLTITKLPATVPLDCFDPANTATWTITVTNTGTASADWVKIVDTLGAYLVYDGSFPEASPAGGGTWVWELGPLAPGDSHTVELTAYLSQPTNDCSLAPRTNTASVTWGCGPDSDDGCLVGGPVIATARATVPDLTITPSNITPVLTCIDDGIHTGRVSIVVRNTGDAPVTGDFRMRVEEAATGWWREGFFGADFGGTLPINANSTRTVHVDGWPVSCLSCTYRFTVTLDLDNVICECNEANNANSRDWTITLPDLTVRREDLALTCAGDGQVSISGTVTLGNEGCGSALTANVPMRFTLRDGAGCPETVLHTWTTTFTGVNIPAGGEQTFNVSHTFPIDLCTAASGCTVSLLIEADYTGSICECDGTNNTLCTEFAWNIPDLTVRRENLSLTCAGDGQVLFTGTVTLGNEGCGPAVGTEKAPIEVQFTLYDRAGCTGTVLAQGQESFPQAVIPAQGEYTFAIDPALYTVNACEIAQGCAVSTFIEVNYAGLICECNGLNNGLCVDFPLEIPDLAVVEVVPVVADACAPGRVEVTVANVGCVDSPAGTVVRIGGAATGEIPLPAIPAGGTATVTVDLNEVLPCGFHEVTATADPDDEVCECSSANNALETTFTVIDPDLTITDLVVLCQGDGSFAVTATVRNVGTEAAPPSKARIWVDGALFHLIDVPALDIGATFPISYVTPRLKCGLDYLFTLTVDEDDAICECNAANNTAEALVGCPCPGLVTGKSTTQILRAGNPVPTDSPVQAGDLITYTLTVRNVGSGWAFNVDLWDLLPLEFTYITGSTSASWPSGSSVADPVGGTGPYLQWDVSATLLPGEVLTLTFQAFVTSGVVQGSSYTNTMGATGNEGEGTPIPPHSGLPGDDDPDDQSSVSHPAAVPALSLDKAITDVLRGGVSRGPAGPVEPGDVIVYTVTIRNVGYGVAYNVDFTDLLPPHVVYDTSGDGTYTVDNPPTGPAPLGIADGSSGLVTADLSATLAVGGALTAVYRVRVLSTASQGVELVNYAVTTGEDGAGTPIPEFNDDVSDTYPDRDSTRIGVVEPGLALDKEIIDVLRGGVSIWPTPIVLWGDVIVYRVTVRNVGLGTAYDVGLTDELPFGVAYDTTHGEGTYTVDSPASAGGLGITDGATGLISAPLGVQLGGGGTLVAVYRVRVTPEAVPGSFLTNLATVTGEDGAGTPIPEFNPDVDDEYPDQDSTTIRLGAPALTTDKAYHCEPCDPCAPEPADCAPCAEEPIPVRVGDLVRFQLTVTNVGYSTAYAIVVEDHLPKGFVYVAESATLSWPGGRTQLEPILGEDSVLTWITGLALDTGESLTIVFAAQMTEGASVGEEVVNVMRAEGVDAFNVPIPADSSMFVIEDEDPEDSSSLRLLILPPPPASSGGGR